MAIVRMQNLRLLAARAHKDELMTKLMLLGCAEIKEQSELLSDPRIAGMVSKEKSELAAFKTEKALLADAIKLLDKYAPDPPPLLSAKPIIQEDIFLDERRRAHAGDIARQIVALDEEIRGFYLEESSCSTLIEVLTPWKDFSVPLEYSGTANVGMKLGTLPTVADFDSLQLELMETVPESDLTELFSDEHSRFLCIFYHRSREAELTELLHSYGFSVPPFGNITGTAADNLEQQYLHLRKIRLERNLREAHLLSFAEDRALLKTSYDRVATAEGKAEAIENLIGTDSVVCMDAWVEESEIEKVVALLEKFDCAYSFTEPDPEEYPDVPVKLKNNFFTNGLNMVTEMYSLPRYGTVDPNPLMAPFFILFYGIMMADMGYGLLMLLAGLIALKKIRPQGGMLHLSQLLVWGGISTFVMGALTGGFFSDAPYQLVHMLNPESTWQGLPALFSPLNDTILILGGSIALGFIHLNTGLVISFVQKVKNGDLIGGLLYEAAIWLIFIGAGVMVLGSMVLDMAAVNTVGTVLLCIGVVALFYGGTRGKKGLGKITSIFGTLYNELTGWFGDLLSYSRIMALMLAGSVIGQVFNTIAAMFNNIILFIIIFIVGHVLNFGLNLLGCYVHDLRLQCLEYFGKFYTDGGKPFKPLKVNSKYVEVTK